MGIWMAGGLSAKAQTPTGANKVELVQLEQTSPVAQVRQAKSWEYGPFVNWGTGVGDRSDFKFLSLGFQLAKPISRPLHAGILSGQFEFGGNIMPLWQAYTPAPHQETIVILGQSSTVPVGGGTYTGVSITPVIFRWNFLTQSRRFQPWFQGAGGLIYTTHKFPPELRYGIFHRRAASGFTTSRAPSGRSTWASTACTSPRPRWATAIPA
jgi:hypothetical protein